MTTLAHANDTVQFDISKKHFYRGDHALCGLLPLLAARFYPTYTYTRATFNRTHNATTEHSQRQSTKHAIKSKTRAKGIDVGMGFDKEMQRTIEIMNRFPSAPMRAIWDTSYAEQASNLPQWFKEKAKVLTPQTRAFWKCMETRKLMPVGAQVCVGNQYATAIDIVCVNEQKESVLIEAKCGFTNYYLNCTKVMMRAPLHLHTDSLFNQWHMQLAASRELYKLTFPSRIIGQCLVVRIDNTSVYCYELKKWALDIPSWSNLIY